MTNRKIAETSKTIHGIKIVSRISFDKQTSEYTVTIKVGNTHLCQPVKYIQNRETADFMADYWLNKIVSEQLYGEQSVDEHNLHLAFAILLTTKTLEGLQYCLDVSAKAIGALYTE